MSRNLLHLWLCGGALGAALAAGCSHCATCGANSKASDSGYVASSSGGLQGSLPPPSPYHPLPTAPLVVHAAVVASPETAVVSVVDSHEESAAPAPKPTADPKGWQVISSSVHETRFTRRTFTDTTANPAFDHAPDFTWLVGELQQAGPDAWCLRFASVEDDVDTVSLVDVPASAQLKAGQMVRVEGKLVDPHAHESRPAYHVAAIHPVN